MKFLDWRGELGQLSLPPDFAVPDGKALFLATIGSRVAVREVKVSPPEKFSSGAWEEEAGAFVGTWTLARGLSWQGLKERWEIQNNKGDWSVKRLLTDKSGKAVGGTISENCKFSGGVLQYTERFLNKKPVANYIEGGTMTLRLDGEGSDRLELNWALGDSRASEKLVRPGALAALDEEANAFTGNWLRVEEGTKLPYTERWEIKKIKGDWMAKRTFSNKTGKVVGYSVSENCTYSDGALRYTERLKQKPAPHYADTYARVLKFESGGNTRIEASWTGGGSSGIETLARSSAK